MVQYLHFRILKFPLMEATFQLQACLHRMASLASSKPPTGGEVQAPRLRLSAVGGSREFAKGPKTKFYG